MELLLTSIACHPVAGAPAEYALAISDSDGDGAPSSLDCDDADPSVGPGAEERCDTPEDDDCDGDTNDLDAVGCGDWYVDMDGDGLGAGTATCHCEAAGAYVTTDGTDCDDTDAALTDVCHGDRIADEEAAVVLDGWVCDVAPAGDLDGDGLGDVALFNPDWSYLDVTVHMGPLTEDRASDDGDLRLYWANMWDAGGMGWDLSGGEDLDGDGAADLAVTLWHHGTGYLWIVPGITRGRVALADPLGTDVPVLTAAASPDTTGDGLSDLFVVGVADDAVDLYPGPVAAGDTPSVRVSGSGLGSTIAAPGDLDGDGIADLVAIDYEGPGTVIFHGPFVADLDVSDADAGIEGGGAPVPRGPVSGDVDGDGLPDFLTSNSYTSVSIVSGLVSGALSVDALPAIITDETNIQTAILGDIDDDGFADVGFGVPLDDGRGFVGVARGPFAGILDADAWTDGFSGAAEGEGVGSRIAGPGDVDGDGVPDVLLAAGGAWSAWILSGALW